MHSKLLQDKHSKSAHTHTHTTHVHMEVEKTQAWNKHCERKNKQLNGERLVRTQLTQDLWILTGAYVLNLIPSSPTQAHVNTEPIPMHIA